MAGITETSQRLEIRPTPRSPSSTSTFFDHLSYDLVQPGQCRRFHRYDDSDLPHATVLATSQHFASCARKPAESRRQDNASSHIHTGVGQRLGIRYNPLPQPRPRGADVDGCSRFRSGITRRKVCHNEPLIERAHCHERTAVRWSIHTSEHPGNERLRHHATGNKIRMSKVKTGDQDPTRIPRPLTRESPALVA